MDRAIVVCMALIWASGVLLRPPWAAGADSQVLIGHMLALAPMVILPLSAPLLPDDAALRGWPARLAARVGPVAALPVWVAHTFLPRGWLAGALVVPWLLVCAGIGLSGAWWLWSRRGRAPIAALTLAVGMVYLPGGALWMLLSRLGVRPMDFPEVIVMLTGIHFHYAGFVAPLLVAMTGRALIGASARLRRVHAAACVGVVLGTPLIAIGITASPLMELVATLWFSTSVLVVGALTLAALPRVKGGAARALLSVSALSSFLSMVAAMLFGGRHAAQLSQLISQLIPPLTIAEMALLHGTANALGFALCGVLGWRLAALPPTDDEAPG